MIHALNSHKKEAGCRNQENTSYTYICQIELFLVHNWTTSLGTCLTGSTFGTKVKMPPDNLVADLRSNCSFPGPSHFCMWTVIQPANKDFYDETRFNINQRSQRLLTEKKGKLLRPLHPTITYEQASIQTWLDRVRCEEDDSHTSC